jgi:hypothetical protein
VLTSYLPCQIMWKARSPIRNLPAVIRNTNFN